MKKIFYLAAAAILLCSCGDDDEKDEKAPGSIYGVITDKATGEPIRAAGVGLTTLGLTTVTGSEGQYEFTDLKADTYTLQATKTGYTDLLNYKITVAAGKIAKGDVQLEKLPASLRVVNDSKQDISELDFGSAESDVARLFNIFNDGPETLEWEVTKTAAWISAVSRMSGTLVSGATQAVTITVDRTELAVGENVTTIHVTTNNGSKQLTVKATNGKKAPSLNTLGTNNITTTTATFNGTITDAGSPAYTERGFVYGTMRNPTVENNAKKIIVAGSGTGLFSVNATEVQEGTTYYVRAYATNTVGTAYGAEVTFTPHVPNVVELPAAGLMVQKTDINGSNPVLWSTGSSLCTSSTVDGYTDWRLPAKDELAVLYNNRSTIGGFTTSGSNYYYWSSSVDNSNNPWYQDFSNGAQYGDYTKVGSFRCRCVRNM
jgi:hypothetical protein